jgi:colicin import membrane protein
MKYYAVALFVALALHAGVVLILVTNWSTKAPDTFRIPKHVSATLVVLPKPVTQVAPPKSDTRAADAATKKALEAAAAKKALEAAAAKKAADAAAAQLKAANEAANKALTDKKAAEALAKKQADEAAAAAAAKKKAEADKARAAEAAAATKQAAADAAKKAADDLAKQKALEIQKQQEAAVAKAAADEKAKRAADAAKKAALAAERAALEGSILDGLEAEDRQIEAQNLQATEDQANAMSYFQMIERQIMMNWSRPPSTRNGMFVGMEMHLLPNGELKDVFITAPSGDSATDLSAERAVRKVTRFEVPKDTRLFELYFRKFEIGFRPEDLKQ